MGVDTFANDMVGAGCENDNYVGLKLQETFAVLLQAYDRAQ